MPGVLVDMRHPLADILTRALLVASFAAALIAYNGHAGLGASAYQPNQTDLEFLSHAAHIQDGTSNTVMF